MKRIKFLFFLFSLFLGTSIILNSCQKEPPVPDCELYHWGDVTVKNSTGYTIWTDVTWGNIVENYEKRLYTNGSYKYTEIPSGSIEIWIRFDGYSDWYYKYENLSDCEFMTYTWYLTDKKSNCPFEIEINGERFTPKPGIKN